MSLVLYAAGNTANRTYDVRSRGSDRIELVETTTGTLANPEVIVQTINLKAPGSAGNDRCNVSIRKNKTNSSTNMPMTGSITIQVSIPKDPTWDDNDTKDLLSQGASIIGAAGAYGTSGAPVSGCTDTSGYPTKFAKMLFVQ
jgi:hypothetical protein